MKKPIVSVVMITYAHENYIEQAINGVLMQVCDFEVELIITNDCSPDKTDAVIIDIIKTHPKASWIKYIRHEKNIGMMPNFIFTLKEAKGKYIAMCEGDDYLTDPLKLQKQVDFLEKNEEYVLSFTKSMELFQDKGGLFETTYPQNIENLNFQELLSHDWFIRTATIVFRKNQLDLTFLNKLKYSADFFLQLLLISKGKFHFLEEITSVYRRHSGGISNSKSIVYLERRLQFMENLKILNKYLDYTFDKAIIKEIRKVKIGIFDFAILNRHFEYFRFIKYYEVLPLIFHLINRFSSKIIRTFLVLK